jgi:peptidoglycan/xylan/chitin deacetylase (PgdA/CDA1 family)
MSASRPSLWAVNYHYVRDLPRTQYPRIRGRLVSDFEQQVAWLSERCEMATLESAADFLAGKYEPSRDLCLLTFDDGLKDHYTNVLPILADRGIQGLFFLCTVCQEQHYVLPVHKNHFLMAALEFGEYRKAFLEQLATLTDATPDKVDVEKARLGYPYDSEDVAVFKFFLNYVIVEPLRVRVLDVLFATYFGDESTFARELYLNWNEAQLMQSSGMIIGGHTHNHVALSTLSNEEQAVDLATCGSVLRKRLKSQAFWPFCYPYGHSYSFNAATIQRLNAVGFMCGFTTETGSNRPGDDLFSLRRVDTNDVSKKMLSAQAAVAASK